jgi:Translationally controlled tumour protein
LESTSKRVVDIVDAFRLQETSWDKKGFMGYIKGYMKAVADKLPEERREKFMAEAPAAVKELLGRFSELQFFTGESMDLEGSMAYAYYKEGATEPTFLYFKDGLKEVRAWQCVFRHSSEVCESDSPNVTNGQVKC